MKKGGNSLTLKAAIVYIVLLLVGAGVVSTFYFGADETQIRHAAFYQEDKSIIRIDRHGVRQIIIANLYREDADFPCEWMRLIGNPRSQRDRLFFVGQCGYEQPIYEYQVDTGVWRELEEFSNKFDVYADDRTGVGFISSNFVRYDGRAEVRQLVYVDLLEGRAYLTEPVPEKFSLRKQVSSGDGALITGPMVIPHASGYGLFQVFDPDVPINALEGSRFSLGEIPLKLKWEPLEL